MTPQQRAELIARYKDGYNQVADAVKGITKDELDFRPAPNKWTPREIVHHLADSEMTSAIRLRKLLVEPNAQIQGYDQEEFARKLHYGERPIEWSLTALQAARATTAQLLDLMSDADWQRVGNHSESGTYSAERWLEIYAVHTHNHADQIRRARKFCAENRSHKT
jgi:hypothetical protein